MTLFCREMIVLPASTRVLCYQLANRDQTNPTQIHLLNSELFVAGFRSREREQLTREI